jgi:hypothetical protein
LSIPAPEPSATVDDRLLQYHDITRISSSADLAASAKQILFGQLADIFLKDLKNRIAGPCIYDFLNPSLIKPSVVEPFPSSATVPTAAVTLKSNIVASARLIDDHSITTDSSSIYKLPRFKRKSISQPSFEPAPMQVEDTDVNITSDQEQEVIAPNKPMDTISTLLRPPSPSPSTIPQAPFERRLSQTNQQTQDSSSSSDDDFLGTLPSKKQLPAKQPTPIQRKSFSAANRRLSTTTTTTTDSSNSDSSIDNEEAYRRITSRKKRKPMLPKRRKSLAAVSAVLPRKKININMVIEESPPNRDPQVVVDSPSNMEIDIDGDDQSGDMMVTIKEPEFDQALLDKILIEVGQPDPEVEAWFIEARQGPSTVTLNKEWDPLCQTKDVEDLEYLRVALIEKVQDTTTHGKFLIVFKQSVKT